MKTFNVLCAADVPCYGTDEVEAETLDQAIEIVRHTIDDILLEPEWDNSENSRIVSIEDDKTWETVEDIILHPSYAYKRMDKFEAALKEILSTKPQKDAEGDALAEIWTIANEALR